MHASAQHIPVYVCVRARVQTLTLAVSSGHLGITGRCHTVTGTAFAFLPEFEEPRVIDLWDLAKSANFTEKELESFRVRKVLGDTGSHHLAALVFYERGKD